MVMLNNAADNEDTGTCSDAVVNVISVFQSRHPSQLQQCGWAVAAGYQETVKLCLDVCTYV